MSARTGIRGTRNPLPKQVPDNRIVRGQGCPRISAGPNWPISPITQLSPYLALNSSGHHAHLSNGRNLIHSIQNELIAQTSGHSAARKISVSLAHGHAKRMAHSLESEESEEAGSGARKEERKTPREGRPSTLNMAQQVSASPAFLNPASRPGAGRVKATAA